MREAWEDFPTIVSQINCRQRSETLQSQALTFRFQVAKMGLDESSGWVPHSLLVLIRWCLTEPQAAPKFPISKPCGALRDKLAIGVAPHLA